MNKIEVNPIEIFLGPDSIEQDLEILNNSYTSKEIKITNENPSILECIPSILEILPSHQEKVQIKLKNRNIKGEFVDLISLKTVENEVFVKVIGLMKKNQSQSEKANFTLIKDQLEKEYQEKISQIYDMMAIKDDIIGQLEAKTRELEIDTYTLREAIKINSSERENEEEGAQVLEGLLKEKEIIIEELYQENKKINERNNENKIKIDLINQENNKLKSEINILSRRLTENQKNDCDKEEITHLNFKITQLTLENQRLNQQIEEIEHYKQPEKSLSSCNSHHSLQSSTRKELEILKESKEIIENQLIESLNIESMLKQRVFELEANIYSLTNDINNMNKELKKNKDLSLIEKNQIKEQFLNENNQLRFYLEEKEKIILENKQNFNNFNNEKQNFNYEKNQLIIEITQLKNLIEKINKEKENILIEKNKIENYLKCQEEHFKQTESSDKILLEELNDLKNFIRDLKNERNKIINELESKNQIIEQEKQENQKFSNLIIRLEKQIKENTETNQILFNEKEIFYNEIEFYKQENNNLNEKIQQLNQDMILNYNSKEELVSDICNLREVLEKNDEKEGFYKDKLSEFQIIIDNLKSEMSIQQNKWEDIKSLYEARIQIITEKVSSDLKEITKKVQNNENIEKIIETYKENLSIFVHKNALIKDLKDKNKSLSLEIAKLKVLISQEKTIKTVPQKKTLKSFKEKEISTQIITNPLPFSHPDFEAKIYTQKLEEKRLKEQILFLSEQIDSYKQNTIYKDREIEVLIREKALCEKENQEKIKIIKQEYEKNQDYQEKKGNKEIQDKINDLENQLIEANNVLKTCKEEILRKKDIINSLKNEISSLKEINENLNKELNTTNQNLNKQKNNNKENLRQNNNLQSLLTKIDENKNIIKGLQIEKNEFLEKIKQFKNELQRKEIIIRDLKEKIENIQLTNQTQKENIEENEKIKEIIKKMKGEIERKDILIIQLKNKIDENISEINTSKINIQKTQIEEINQKKLIDNVKNDLKNYETNIQMLNHIIKRLYREIHNEKYKKKLRKEIEENQNKNQNSHVYDSVKDILQLTNEEIEEFIDPKTTKIKTNVDESCDKFDQMVENLQINDIYENLRKLILI